MDSSKVKQDISAHEKSKAGELTLKEQQVMFDLYRGADPRTQDMEGLNLERMVTQLQKNNQALLNRLESFSPHMQGLARSNLVQSENVVKILEELIKSNDQQANITLKP